MFALLARRFSFGNIARKLALWCVDVVVIAIALGLALLLPAQYLRSAGPYLAANYDFDLNWVDEDSLSNLEKQGYAEEGFVVSSIVQSSLAAGENSETALLDLCQSYDNQELFYFNSGNLLASAPEDGLGRADGISIDLNLATRLGVGVGDTVEYEYFGGAIPFTVERIYEPTDMVVGYLALAQFNDYFLSYWASDDAELAEFEYSNAYITCADPAVTKSYLRSEYMGPGAQDMTASELASARDAQGQGVNLSRPEQVEACSTTVFTSVPFIAVISLLAMLVLSAYILRTSRNEVERKQRDFAVLKALGLHSSTLRLWLLLDRLVFLALALVVAVPVAKLVVFEALVNIVISWNLVLAAGACVLAFIVVDSLVCALANVRRISTSPLPMMLSAGE